MVKMKDLKNRYREFLRRHIRKRYQQSIKNKDCSIISMNCVGGVVSHELGLRFNSPTVNLWFKPKEFIKFLERLDYYLYDCELQMDAQSAKEYGYPVGRLDDIDIYFAHYESFEQAKQKWNERLKRLDRNNIYIVMVQRDGFTEQDILSFDKLKFKHKVVFTAKKYPQCHSAYYIPRSEENKNSIKNLCDYQNQFTGKLWLDEFDWISFLNKE